MLKEIKIEDILFLDIETVPQNPTYSETPERLRGLWDKKATFLLKETETPESIYNRSGIYAEFGKIICISVGLVVIKNNEKYLRLKSFFGDDEQVILKSFAGLLDKFENKTNAQLCAHNGKEFDFPYIARRMVVHGIDLPILLDVAGKKPWEVKFLDTMELWKFGDYKHYTSLDLLTSIFNIPSPKDDIDGSQVAEVYYRQKDLNRIVRYCEKDVLSIVQIFLKYKNDALIKPENIERVQD